MTTVNATYDRVVVCILMQERAELAEREAKEKEKAGQNKTSFKRV